VADLNFEAWDIPVGAVHVDKADKASAMAAMKGISPVDKAVMVPLRQALADRVKGLQAETKTPPSIKAAPERLSELRGFLTGDPVVTLQGNEVPRFPKLGQLAQAVGDLWARKYGNRVVNPELGEIVIDRRGAKTSVAHGMSAEKGVAFAAVPDILSKGRVLGSETRGNTDGIFVGAPVRLSGKDYTGVALVKKDTNGQRFYLHEVVLKEKLQGSIKTRAPENSGERTGGTAGAFRKILDTIFSPGKDEDGLSSRPPSGPEGIFRKGGKPAMDPEEATPVTRQSLQETLADTPLRGAIVLDSPADLPSRGLRDYMERTVRN
jgi:hypothetical protein